MNNIQVKMPSGEIIPVELISAFKLDNLGKEYIFYTKGEIVENNLIKMYAAEVLKPEETVSLGNKMTDDEWNNLKNVMKSILTGSINLNIKYVDFKELKTNDLINLKEANVIALQQTQKDKLLGTYNSSAKEPIQNESIMENQNVIPAEILQTEMANPIIDFSLPTSPEKEATTELAAPILEESKTEPAIKENKYAAGEKRLEETQSLIEKELLSIINKINVLQRDLDSLGEDIINFSNLYKVKPKENENLDKIKDNPIVSDEIMSENISPFNILENQTNIFD